MTQNEKFVPRSPDLKGKIQTVLKDGSKIEYKTVGETNLWKQQTGKYLYQGNVKLQNGETYRIWIETPITQPN